MQLRYPFIRHDMISIFATIDRTLFEPTHCQQKSTFFNLPFRYSLLKLNCHVEMIVDLSLPSHISSIRIILLPGQYPFCVR